MATGVIRPVSATATPEATVVARRREEVVPGFGCAFIVFLLSNLVVCRRTRA